MASMRLFLGTEEVHDHLWIGKLVAATETELELTLLLRTPAVERWLLGSDRRLGRAPAEVKATRECVLAAVREGPPPGLHWAPDFQDDDEIVREAVRRCPAELQWASPRLRDDAGIVHLALRGAVFRARRPRECTFKFASERLRQHWGAVLLAQLADDRSASYAAVEPSTLFDLALWAVALVDMVVTCCGLGRPGYTFLWELSCGFCFVCGAPPILWYIFISALPCFRDVMRRGSDLGWLVSFLQDDVSTEVSFPVPLPGGLSQQWTVHRDTAVRMYLLCMTLWFCGLICLRPRRPARSKLKRL